MIARLTGTALTFAPALLMTLIAPASAKSEGGPGTYAVRAAVTPVAGSSLQRLRVPARALVAAQSADLADVRIFNAAGDAVPLAVSTPVAQRQRMTVALRVLPILGAGDAMAVTGVTLRIDERQRASVVRVDGTPQRSEASELLGVLLDTRRIADPVGELVLDLASPAGQPVTFTLESSADLKDWQPLADKVVYRDRSQSGRATIAFPTQDLHGRYLRMTWRANSRLLAPVAVRSAEAVVMRTSADSQPPRAVLLVPPRMNRHVIEFTVPFAAAIEALEIAPRGADTVVPIRILGRNQREEPWTPIASGALFRVTSQDGPRANPAFDLHGTRWHNLRLEADERSAGFPTAPKIAVRLAPVELVFLATGSAPYTLAAGKDGEAAGFLPLDDLLRTAGSVPVATLPLAATTSEPDPVVMLAPATQGVAWQRVLLWAVLLGATALLAAMVWLLVRRREPAG